MLLVGRQQFLREFVCECDLVSFPIAVLVLEET